MATRKIKNWDRFQHFKDRRPVWIKLYREILDDFDINTLTPEAFKFLVQVWLVASEDPKMNGNLPSVDAIAHRLRLSKNKTLSLLQQVDIFLISDGYQADIPHALAREEEEIEKEKPPLTPQGDVEDIFETWKSEHGHPKALLDEKRERAIKGRLKERYTPDRIKQAIRGIKKSPHHMGDNDRKTVYDDIELICRNGRNVDKFADLEEIAIHKAAAPPRNRAAILDMKPLTPEEQERADTARREAKKQFGIQ